MLWKTYFCPSMIGCHISLLRVNFVLKLLFLTKWPHLTTMMSFNYKKLIVWFILLFKKSVPLHANYKPDFGWHGIQSMEPNSQFQNSNRLYIYPSILIFSHLSFIFLSSFFWLILIYIFSSFHFFSFIFFSHCRKFFLKRRTQTGKIISFHLYKTMKMIIKLIISLIFYLHFIVELHMTFNKL